MLGEESVVWVRLPLVRVCDSEDKAYYVYTKSISKSTYPAHVQIQTTTNNFLRFSLEAAIVAVFADRGLWVKNQ